VPLRAARLVLGILFDMFSHLNSYIPGKYSKDGLKNARAFPELEQYFQDKARGTLLVTQGIQGSVCILRSNY